MRLLIVILVLVLLVVVDQSRFRGYYGSQLSKYVTQVSHYVVHTVRSVI